MAVVATFGTNAGGTNIAAYGLAIGQNAALQCQGAPNTPNWFVAYNLRLLPADEKLERREAEKSWREFRLLKGPDFVSRLHGHLDVLGPNPRTDTDCVDVTRPIRRALVLRALLKLDAKQERRRRRK